MTADLRVGTAPSPTRPAARIGAMLGFGALLVLWSVLIGIPNDTGGVVLWVWFGTIAWNIQAPREEHLAFWRDWWRPLLVLVVYWLLRGLADEIGTPIHYSMPIRFDDWLGGGVTPTERLQEAWCGDPCLKSTPPRWYDTVFTTVYASHFLVGLTVAGVLWVRNRAVWVLWMRRFVALHVVALVLFWTYPMAPPWMASRDGYLGAVSRVSSRGWSELDLHRQTMVLFGMANKSAAMPSLHAGLTFLLAFFVIAQVRSSWRWLVLLYPLTMTLVLVYSGEHYVIDAVVGALLAGAVMVGCRIWEDRRRITPL
ncbi:MAG: phosphatase PAP2 family protein [Nocardioides sp.]